jgi:hypothetical protein
MLIEKFIYIKEIKVIIFSSLMIITTNFLRSEIFSYIKRI